MQNIVRRFSVVFLFALVLSACGYQLRGMTDLAFKKLYIQGASLSISKDLKRSFTANGIQLVNEVEEADLLLELLSETNEKRILSLSGAGVVREYELNYRASFRTRAPTSPTWSQPQTVQTRRNYSYNDSALLGKAEEEAMLNVDMHKDAVREILRRLTAVKPAAEQ
ncbi:MAG: LPS assembly lipoprotein LptE [Methylotenera sp.]|uniref:LPS-assembly lipoprotein LptE n=1 Tax=Methylotenera sp. TaxID=2051956 RepID=UPI0024899908|nr:LPS assembly lipoprotein LptE [Methylotenera sp.]MDI1310329.1 LPS assembly lipoprotein LptE [Methylotenera sp.]